MEWRWLLLLGLVLYSVFKILDLLLWRPRKLQSFFAKQGIHGPPYKLFFGNVKEMVTLMMDAKSLSQQEWSHDILPRVLAFYPHWRKLYGSTFLLWFGPTPRLAVSDPDLIREILVSRSDCYEKYESHPLVRQLEGEGLLSLTGEKWAHHRKLISPTFHMDNLRLLVPRIARAAEEMTERWIAMSASSGEAEVDVSEWYQGLAEDAITQTAFGVSYEEGKSIFQLQAKQMDFAAEAFRNVFIPGYRFLPTQKNVDSWRLDKEINRMLVRLIGTRKKIPEDPEGRAAKARDLLGLLISANGGRGTKVSAAQPSPAVTIRDIVEECKTFFFAGKHTTSNLLTWATLLLAMHPEWQERARDEVVAVCGSRDVPTRDHVTRLRTLSMVLNETLRLYPPAVATIRRAKVDVALGGRYVVPRGTEVLVPIVAVHHDRGLWGPDAAEFNPGRFAEGVARAASHPTAFIPFGLGARTCIGQNLAMVEAKVTLAVVLQRFRFEPSPAYVHSPAVLMLLYPQLGAPVVFRPLGAIAVDRGLDRPVE